MYQTPDDVYGELFAEVQQARIFSDSKTFADCLPKTGPEKILRAYSVAKSQPGFSLYEFVFKYFSVPGQRDTDFTSDRNLSLARHIDRLWPVLSRPGDLTGSEDGSSLIPLPHPYVVPGGRFREIYYWDSYFTQLGLAAGGQWKLIEDMLNNFGYLINLLGHIPNGNRTYFISRSQPPFFAFMVELMAKRLSESLFFTYREQLKKEYDFWMEGQDQLDSLQIEHRRVVRLENGDCLNRYFDDHPGPRPESYREDVHLSGQSSRKPEDLYLNLRAACESGWDFSSRWCEVPGDLTTIRTTDLIAVDLNCCLLKLEEALEKAYKVEGKMQNATKYQQAREKRIDLIMRFCWDETKGYFFDYDFRRKTRSESIHAAGLFPLFLGFVTQEVADRCIQFYQQQLWAPGGILTTRLRTGQQWDAPNGWAPLQWVAYKALTNYGYREEAADLFRRWTGLNERVFLETGKLMEKYNVQDADVLAGGGEYPVQDGFGWTNGVYLAMLHDHEVSGT